MKQANIRSIEASSTPRCAIVRHVADQPMEIAHTLGQHPANIVLAFGALPQGLSDRPYAPFHQVQRQPDQLELAGALTGEHAGGGAAPQQQVAAFSSGFDVRP